MSMKRCIQPAWVAWGFLFVALTYGCDDGTTAPPSDTLAIQLAPTNSGDGQTDTVGGTLANPLRVLVLRDQRPVQGIAVSWTALTGSVSPTSTTTDASGIAWVTRTLGDTVGEQFATASLPNETAVNDTVALHVTFSSLVRPGVPTALAFRPGPSKAFVGRPLIPVVRVAAVDRRANLATDFRAPVTVALGTAPGGASLTGTTTVDAVDGVAAFTSLSLDRTGVGYTLTASAGGLTGVTSATFEIVSPGSGRIAFESNRDGNAGIYTMNADGSGLVNLTNNLGDHGPAWSPDGTRIAFGSDRDGNREIYVINADGSGLRNLPGSEGGPWSPDGTRFAFLSNRDGNREIYVINADGSGLRNLTNNPASEGPPAWSPDGTRIAFSSDRDGGDEIYVMNADGGGVTKLTTRPLGLQIRSQYPVWSPDGTRIAFYSPNFLGYNNGAIYVMNADGSGIRHLTNTSGSASQPVWSPDGSKIAYTDTRIQCFGSVPRVHCVFFGYIIVVNADGTGVRQLTNTGKDYSPAWSPDGTRIAFNSGRDGNLEVYLWNADGSGVINLTNNPGADYSPAWQPR